MRRSLSAGLGVAVLVLGAAELRSDELSDCYSFKIPAAKNKTVTVAYSGEALRRLLNHPTSTAANPGIAAVAKKPNAEKCTGAQSQALKDANFAAAGSTYYGAFSSPAHFRKMAELQCGGAGGVAHQFFALGSAVYYRYCGGGDGNNYIYYYGIADKKTACVAGHDYPTMYAEVLKGRPKLTAADVRKASKGDLGKLDQAAFALGNATAAVLVAEAARDGTLKLANFLLLDIAEKKKLSPMALIGGVCPTGVPKNECQNADNYGVGIHPIAWGGAQAATTTGAWPGPTGTGLSKDVGKRLEARIVQQWLVAMKGASLQKKGACVKDVTLNALTANDKAVESMLKAAAGYN